MSSAIIRRNLRALNSASKRLIAPTLFQGKVSSAQFITPSKRFFSQSRVTQNLPEIQQALFNKLNSEIAIEQENPIDVAEQDQEYLKASGFEIVHTRGEKNVTLTKKLSTDTTVSVYFDCTELNDIRANTATETERVGGEEDGAEVDVEEEFNYEDQLENSLMNINVLVENDATGESLLTHAFLSYEDLEFFPQSFQVIKDAELAKSLSAEAQQVKLSKYNGPGFQLLDEELQELFQAYFAELGCDEALGEFITNYSTISENEEYLHWLQDLKSFFK